ncbi:MAG: Bax inhibitor-1/YccA family protein [Flavobacteriaceae bacterium]
MEQTYIQRNDVADVQRIFIQKVYTWMTGALILTAVTAYFLGLRFDEALSAAEASGMDPQSAIDSVIPGSWMMFSIIAQFGLVIALSAAINKMSSTTAFVLFLVYSILTGVTFSTLSLVYTGDSIALTFFVTAGTFAVMSIYGMTTKRDLTKMRSLLFMALIGLIIASVANMFFASSMLYWAITYAGILIFVGLIAYDTQKIKTMSTQFTDAESHNKGAILGALTLYLDFINLFLYLLRLFGDRRN